MSAIMTYGFDPEIPTRIGRAPLVSTRGRIEQITQSAPVELQQVLLQLAGALPGVRIGPSHICVAGSRACHLAPTIAVGPAQAFFSGTEFGHMHPLYDGSLHLNLPDRLAERVLAAGWGAGAEPGASILVYGPRDEDELDIVWQLLLAAYRHGAPTPVPAAGEGTHHDADPDRQAGPELQLPLGPPARHH
jgi:hypothetical protein